jgi:hypothetical protein
MLVLKEGHKYPLPRWDLVASDGEAQALSGPALHAFWMERGRDWMRLLLAGFGAEYRWFESANFWLLCSRDEKTCLNILRWAEHVHRELLAVLGDIMDRGMGRIPILVTADIDAYYAYVAEYMPDGDHALSGGMYLYQGYGHFVFCYHQMGEAEAVIAHELAHALLLGLPIPTWLNEGIAQLAEMKVTGRYRMDVDVIKETLGTFWTPETIQEFWRGCSFDRQDYGHVQSYHLAFVLTRNLTQDMKRFFRFVNEANAADAGEAALKRHYGFCLEELVADYLGEGDWRPCLPAERADPG